MKNVTELTDAEIKEIKNYQLERAMRRGYYTGLIARKTIKWGLLALGAAAVVGYVKRDDNTEIEEEN